MRSIWVLNEKGGTGKTTISTVLADHMLATGAPVRIVDADTQPDQQGRSSLGAFCPSAGRIDIGVAPEALMAKPSLAMAHWDGLFEMAKSSDMLADFGANVANSLIYWYDESEVGVRMARAGIHLDVVLVTTAHPDAVSDTLALIKRLRNGLPAGASRLFVALNSGHGDFSSYADSAEMAEFASLQDAGVLTLLTVPMCTSEIWRDVERNRLTALAAASMSSEELVSRLGTPELETIRGRKALARWHGAVVEAFMDAGVLADDRGQ